MNPLGNRVSYFYHVASNPTATPIIIDNKPYVLTEHLSRHIVDTKLSFLIPHPQIIIGMSAPENPPLQPTSPFNPMSGNVEQQIILDRMQAQYFMDMMNANTNQQVINPSPSYNGLLFRQPPTSQDASTHTYDLLDSRDVDMKSLP